MPCSPRWPSRATPEERANCRPFLDRELELLVNARVFVVLGQIGYDSACSLFGVRPKPRFGHGVEVPLPDGRTILCSYHVSQQNTFTGKLTEPMLDAVFTRARELTAKH